MEWVFNLFEKIQDMRLDLEIIWDNFVYTYIYPNNNSRFSVFDECEDDSTIRI